MKYTELTIKNPRDLIFGSAPQPVTTKRGLVIGGGTVYPELNFTLPAMKINPSDIRPVVDHYKEIVDGALHRALELYSKGVVLEFETLIEMTQNPDLGVELVKQMNAICEEYYIKHGLKSEIRLTPNDLREFERPPKQRTTKLLDPMMELFERGAEAGGDLLSIESTGGKEISDDALMMCDIKQFIFAQSVLGVRDMQMLWKKIVLIAEKTGAIPGGDTACGFGNTAMVLAEKKYIPKTFAAIARVVTIIRSMVAIEEGAKGPDKDCGYEGPFLKAITGIPISMEGKTAACAHLSPMGNIAAACADLWSNESVQNIKLLAGMAPTIYLEQLEYDVRLMNEAIKGGKNEVLQLQKLFIRSDAYYDPQAFILAPENVIEIAAQIVKGNNYIDATKRACLKALDLISIGIKGGTLLHDEKEDEWINLLKEDISMIPENESEFVEMVLPTIDSSKVFLSEYGL
ncbi:MAG: methanol--corrinoid methyltransferase [Cyclobacteriaceae bacterium]|nr:methanol--corrinoid methyltransferase [Cyclobacteriaceae bacterium]